MIQSFLKYLLLALQAKTSVVLNGKWKFIAVLTESLYWTSSWS